MVQTSSVGLDTDLCRCTLLMWALLREKERGAELPLDETVRRTKDGTVLAWVEDSSVQTGLGDDEDRAALEAAMRDIALAYGPPSIQTAPQSPSSAPCSMMRRATLLSVPSRPAQRRAPTPL